MDLARKLSAWDAAAIVVGTVIGGGIFLVPSLIAREVPSVSGILTLWVVAAIFSFLGALAYAELGAMFPAAGGQYVYLREAWGPAAAFLCGWATLVVIMPAQMGALAVGFSIYLGYFIPLSDTAAKACSVTLILILTAINYRGVSFSAGLQNVMTALKLLGIAAVIGAALFAPGAASEPDRATLHLGTAMVACLLAYDGWNMVATIAGEMKNPQRDFPKALALGLGIVVTVYLLMNAAILHVLPVSTVANTERVGAVVAEQALGRMGATLVTVTILLSVLGSLNGGVLTFPRVFFAQANDGLLFHSLAAVHPTFRTPHVSIVAQAVLSIAAALTGSYAVLITYAVFVGWIFYLWTVLGLFRLRRTQPDAPRPFRMWGYPITPAAFVAAALWFLGNTLWTQPKSAFTGLAILAAGIPVYAFVRARMAR